MLPDALAVNLAYWPYQPGNKIMVINIIIYSSAKMAQSTFTHPILYIVFLPIMKFQLFLQDQPIFYQSWFKKDQWLSHLFFCLKIIKSEQARFTHCMVRLGNVLFTQIFRYRPVSIILLFQFDLNQYVFSWCPWELVFHPKKFSNSKIRLKDFKYPDFVDLPHLHLLYPPHQTGNHGEPSSHPLLLLLHPLPPSPPLLHSNIERISSSDTVFTPFYSDSLK